MSGLQRQLVRHEGQEFELWQNGAQDERRVLDLDLARWAGASNPSNIVALIDRHGPDLRDLGDLYAVEIAAPARGGKGRTAVYLNEPQALYLLAKMETPRARSTLKLMIVVFVKAVHGDHYPRAAELEDLRARVERLEARPRSARRPTSAPRVPRPPKDELVKRVKDALSKVSAPITTAALLQEMQLPNRRDLQVMVGGALRVLGYARRRERGAVGQFRKWIYDPLN